MTTASQCGGQDNRNWLTSWFGSGSQTCYAPGFGFYSGNNRHKHHDAALHGYYYRRPYNYRHQFDYPGHAALHAPQFFSTIPCGPSAGDVILAPQDEPGAAGPLQPIPSSPTMPAPMY
ncbi:MAG: hypothetical protein HQ567_14005 [Candidatus Nealsonbacteria bacterium]|nr:hypothetical protein [Candidatus Nealsonbacteria bacterium]